MALLRDEASRAGCLRTSELRDHAGEHVRFAGIVAALRRVPMPHGSVLEFVTLEDEEGLVESIVPPMRYGRLDDPIRNPGPYLVEGPVAVEGRHVQLEIDSVTPFHRRGRPYAA
jgi:DNA polymerase III alpha subunit